MELLREEQQMQTYNADLEAQKHNALIKERYKRLQDTIATQLAEEKIEERNDNGYVNTNATQSSLYISPNTVNTAAYMTSPTIADQQSLLSSTIFTTARFEQMQQPVVEEVAKVEPVAVATPVEMVTAKNEAQYSLSPMAKIAMAVFTVTVVGMLTLIGFNTNAINQKQLNIQHLEQRRAELVEQNAEIQNRIENATSEETIREYAESQGMVQKGNE